MNQNQIQEQELEIEQFRLSKIIKTLSKTKVIGTSAVSLYIPPKKIISDITNRLNTQFSEAASIQDKVNRTSVQDSIQGAVLKLKKYTKAPASGLVLFSGLVEFEKGQKKISYVIEPFRPLQLSLFFCDNYFHIEQLEPLLKLEPSYGFIIMDGNGALFGKVQGISKETLKSFNVDLPKKHNKGGQSSLRFSRIRYWARHNYLIKVSEQAKNCFISDDKPTIKGLVLAGIADFKNKLAESPALDKRLQPLILSIVDVNYGGENGFNQAIQYSQEVLQNQKLQREKDLVAKFFLSLDLDNGKSVYGVVDTMKAIEQELVKQVICIQTLEYSRVECISKQTGVKSIKYLKGLDLYEQGSLFEDNKGEQFQVTSCQDLVEYLAENYREKGIDFQLISDNSAEGHQFYKGFGGMAGFFRFSMKMQYNMDSEEEWKSEDDEFI
ncbi:unnamed protein product (macronuclear) [Paramecium tetraurelia]|uniref:Eukaryotic peptide chain release factor subunit 1 n=1 Tax=Paramecium tetraurelia TaxID=5888 RepID=A0DCH9_PARTE|nr:uncharacterized protein GSPATT00015624001 [Paramecium tetraurelia]CAK80746.1 unnamed protein product [Paramecium tetraurelia]|eukprot:XP_001448143.1 hypothetical protein (macronuclear) [Paramecium tetraurelia strain d4-2]